MAFQRVEGHPCVRFLTPTALLFIFFAVNLLNYMDRGIIPGCPEQVGAFIKEDLNVNATKFYLGLQQSSFIAGYALSSLAFGHLVHLFPAFPLMGVGLLVWCVAVLITGLAPRFWVLIIGRMLSGVGEGSFQTIVPPFIDDIAPPKHRAMWLAIFFSAIPVGTAIGFGYGSVMAHHVSWRWAFVLEAPPMLATVLLCYFVPYRLEHDTAPADADADEVAMAKADHPTFKQELMALLHRPVYIFLVLGISSYTFVTAGLAAFGPTFMNKLGLIESEEAASIWFGVAVCLAGLVGTPIGGWLLDRFGDSSNLHRHLCDALRQQTIMAFIGTLVCVAATFVNSTLPFMFMLTLGCTCLFVTTAATNAALMWSVPTQTRSFAIGIAVLVYHVLGDVISPSIIGEMADTLAPDTASKAKQAAGYRYTMFLLMLYLSVMVVCWAIAFVLSKRRLRRRSVLEEDERVARLLHEPPRSKRTPPTADSDLESLLNSPSGEGNAVEITAVL